MWNILAQITEVGSAVPQWIGAIGTPALVGVLLYYLVTKAIPDMQNRFHEAIEHERESRERTAEKTFEEHRSSIKSLIERDEKRTDIICSKIDSLANNLRARRDDD